MEAQKISKGVSRILTALAIVAGIVLFVLWRADNHRVEQLRMRITDGVLPSMAWVTRPVDFLASMTEDSRALMDVYEQNKTLRREIQHLKSWRETARRLEEENARLRALNNVRLAPRTTFVTGDVIADSGGPFRQTVLVNVGVRDGVLDGSAGVDGNGLVGRIVGVGEHAARMLLLTDFSSRIPVAIQPSGQRAILAGDGTPAPVLDFIEAVDQISPGDPIVTSGAGGLFPPNLPVGRVIMTAAGTWRAVLAADYARLEFVRLLRYRPDTGIDRPGDLVVPARPAAPGTLSNGPLGAITPLAE
ncbi:MAG: rod shape-determining protein MreC [Pseudomonadota bacterium]